MGTKLSELQKEKIREIDDIASVSFNQEQKAIAKKIIENTPDSDLHEVFNFITQRVKLGFVFDEAPEVNHDAVSFVRENENLNINITNLENLAGNIEHKLIIGENYDALKNLLVTHYEKIDVIYIDPPYNTEAMKGDGNDYKDEISANKFIYRDKFTRNGWLNMMNERLKLARKLLKDSGVIFISIDDREQAYLKVLCDEIFGEENFVANFIVQHNPRGRSLSKILAQTHEYCISYCRDYKNLKPFLLNKTDKSIAEYNRQDEKGLYREMRLMNGNRNFTRQERPNLYFPLYVNPQNCLVSTQRNEKYTDEVFPINSFNVEQCWTWSKNKIERENDLIVARKKSNGKWGIYRKDYLNENSSLTKTKTILADKMFNNENGTETIRKIFNDSVFSTPKPVELIKYLVNFVLPQSISQSSRPIILDFFAGSGTTAQAVMELNAEDGGRRECILVTNNENNIAINVTRERLYRVINGEGINGESIKWQYSKDKKCLEGNSVRVFEIETHELSLKDLEKAQDLTNIAKGELQKLNPEYDINDELKIYSELASLNPQKDK
ncbi:site-specific DNA-methyltransferase [Campylobacter sp. LR291e]|uniref:site-specific DNA-methyltransferase n=1 Tax=Campylobacter sp. LR291e TaxID=2593546 RepID=UPI00123A2A17|nr:site-specific DNA-methyltransferase [Campylobacter sp. LR291e]KAA6230228.1 site-specific DNA-methyltransferase [Campylobacter sp. LR291e]